jgi:hypothetical protein
MPITTKELAETLRSILTMHFGGKPEGRYIIARDRLADLAGRKILRESYLQELHESALEAGIVVINLDSYFSVQELDVIVRHRSVPPSVIQRITKK